MSSTSKGLQTTAGLRNLPRRADVLSIVWRDIEQSTTTWRQQVLFALLALAAVTLASCGPPQELTLTPVALEEGAEALRVRTMMETHGLRTTKDSRPAPRAFAFDLPPRWSKMPKTQYRLVNLRFGSPSNPGQCYLTQLPGGGGPLLDNVNRWRNQMDMPRIGRAELAELPRREIPGLEVEAVLVDLRGKYTGMSGQAKEGQRFVGLIWRQGGVGHYLVCLGDRDVVDAAYPAFERVIATLRPSKPSDTDGESAMAALRRSLAYDLPPTWRKAPEKSMRILNFWVGEGEDAYCYLANAGGNLSDNVNRWRRQLGAPALDAAAIAALPKVSILTVDATVVDAKGDFGGGMGAKAIVDAQLVGAIATVPGATLFVKMLGPRSVVAAERENFLAFCKSLRSGARGGAASRPSKDGAAKKGDDK